MRGRSSPPPPSSSSSSARARLAGDQQRAHQREARERARAAGCRAARASTSASSAQPSASSTSPAVSASPGAVHQRQRKALPVARQARGLDPALDHLDALRQPAEQLGRGAQRRHQRGEQEALAGRAGDPHGARPVLARARETVEVQLGARARTRPRSRRCASCSSVSASKSAAACVQCSSASSISARERVRGRRQGRGRGQHRRVVELARDRERLARPLPHALEVGLEEAVGGELHHQQHGVGHGAVGQRVERALDARRASV